MPDSLTALAILALVGLPGFTYMRLRGETVQPQGERSAATENLETIFFGLACALGGVVLSLRALDGRWTRVLADPASEASTNPLVEHAPAIIGVAFVGSLLTAMLLAGLVRMLACFVHWLRGRPARKAAKKEIKAFKKKAKAVEKAAGEAAGKAAEEAGEKADGQVEEPKASAEPKPWVFDRPLPIGFALAVLAAGLIAGVGGGAAYLADVPVGEGSSQSASQESVGG